MCSTQQEESAAGDIWIRPGQLCRTGTQDAQRQRSTATLAHCPTGRRSICGGTCRHGPVGNQDVMPHPRRRVSTPVKKPQASISCGPSSPSSSGGKAGCNHSTHSTAHSIQRCSRITCQPQARHQYATARTRDGDVCCQLPCRQPTSDCCTD